MTTAQAPSAAHFNPARFVQLLASLVLFAAVAHALSSYVNLLVAAALALVLTQLLKQAVMLALQSLRQRRRLAVAGWCLASGLLGSTTVALTAASVYERLFAGNSAIQDFMVRREPAERQLQAQLSRGQQALRAAEAWAADAAEKQQLEATRGGTCANRLDTRGIPGEIARWRDDDMRIARDLAASLQGTLQGAQQALQATIAIPRPRSAQEVQAAFGTLNTAVDAAAPLAGDAGIASGALQTLRARRLIQVEPRSGLKFACSDAARDQLLDSLDRNLDGVMKTIALPRMSPGVDLSSREDITTRAWLRSYNGVLKLISLNHAGSFADDPLMSKALADHGIINRETLMFILASIAELGLVVSTIAASGQGQTPFRSQWLDRLAARPEAEAEDASAPANGWQGALRQLRSPGRWAARAVANLLYAHPLEAEQAAMATASSASDWSAEPEPDLSAGQRAWIQELAPYAVLQPGGVVELVIPQLPGTRRARGLAHELSAQRALKCLSASATLHDAPVPPDIAERWDRQLGVGVWRESLADHYFARGSLARSLRLADVQPAAKPIQPQLLQFPILPSAAAREPSTMSVREPKAEGA